MKNPILICLVGLVALFGSCENTAPEIVPEDPDPMDCVPQYPEMDITYTNYVKEIMTQYCVECHHQGNSQGPGDFSTYNGVSQYLGSFNARVLSSNADMPQGNAPLPQSIRDSLTVWIANCAPVNE
ncbi:hypothetical protein [Sunxiuqinia sp. sy24]|uniref:hypothetical protein n=1 Tax=Sunxiuqinia sp. sy24 TaxID=3461495 RepID=UPI004046314F